MLWQKHNGGKVREGEGKKNSRGSEGRREEVTRGELKCSGSQQLAGHLPPINQATARSPVELELTGAIGNRGSVELESLVSGLGGRELDEAIASVAKLEAI